MELKASFLVVLLLATASSESTAEGPPDSDESANDTGLSKQAEYIADGKYTLYTNAASWLEALLSCWEKGGDLAVPTSREDAVVLGRLLSSSKANISGADMLDAVFVGLTDSEVEGDWWTIKGSSVAATGYNDWLGGLQERNESANCAALLPDGHYIQLSCEAELAYACEPWPTLEDRSDGYVDFLSIGTYKLHTEPLTWTEAGRRCEEEGAKLAVPTSPRAAGLLAGTLIMASKNEIVRREGFFVGINDLAAEGVWRTILDERLQLTGFTAWALGEPSGGRDENCGALLVDGRYADYPCSKPMAFCCELGGPRRRDEEPFASIGPYYLFTEPLSWLSAAISCRRMNATLAVPKSKEEFDTLLRLASLSPNRHDGFHLGAIYTNQQYLQTSSIGEDIFYDDLRSYHNDKCIFFKYQSYNWCVSYCSTRRSYICEPR